MLTKSNVCHTQLAPSQPRAQPVILTQLILKEVQDLVQHLEHSVIALGLQVVGEVLLVLVCQAPEGELEYAVTDFIIQSSPHLS